MCLCNKCLAAIFENLMDYGYQKDLLILKALDGKSKNLEELSLDTKMSISKRRDSIFRLLGACLIQGERDGNSKMFSLTENGKQLVEIIKHNKLEN